MCPAWWLEDEISYEESWGFESRTFYKNLVFFKHFFVQNEQICSKYLKIRDFQSPQDCAYGLSTSKYYAGYILDTSKFTNRQWSQLVDLRPKKTSPFVRFAKINAFVEFVARLWWGLQPLRKCMLNWVSGLQSLRTSEAFWKNYRKIKLGSEYLKSLWSLPPNLDVRKRLLTFVKTAVGPSLYRPRGEPMWTPGEKQIHWRKTIDLK